MGIDFVSINWASISLRTVISLIFGGLLGMERGTKNRPAGVRTYMLVCFGATLVMMTNQYVVQAFHTGSDPVRMGAQVISGIGFLCAGSIMITGRNQVRGLTTAAGLWGVACTGLAIGIGFYSGALIGGTLIYVILAVMSRWDTMIHNRAKEVAVYIEFSKKHTFSEFLFTARESELHIADIQIIKNKALGSDILCAMLTVKSRIHTHDEIISLLKSFEGLQFLEEM
jgi:putative Mg2+ transporter-C (MgtC) family protein